MLSSWDTLRNEGVMYRSLKIRQRPIGIELCAQLLYSEQRILGAARAEAFVA